MTVINLGAQDGSTGLSYTLHAMIRQTNTTICKKYTCKPFQNHAKCPQGIPLRGNEVSNAFNQTRMGDFMKNMRKCTQEISHNLGCHQITRSADLGWESPHCWAAVSRAPKFGPEFHDVTAMQERGATSDRWRHRQVLHDVTSSVVCYSLFVKTRNSDLNSGALETAE
jgi:hypothetical protein